MPKWTVEAVSADRAIVTLTRPETLTVHVGDHVDIERSPKWGGGNRGRIVEILDDGVRCDVMRENRRTKHPTPGPSVGVFIIPYSKIVGRIY